jgi:3-hydroxy-9,10-secoandrosta-1,3,5(10)-triene-9,17-dione monooxygenase reductase component
VISVAGVRGTESAASEGIGTALDCRPLYRALASSVTVITACGASGPQGMTASSVTAVSMEPPLMALTFAPGSQTLAAVRLTGRFAINVLGENQQAISTRFAGQRPSWARFAGVDLGDDELPVITDAAAVAVCTLEWERGCGDRVLVVGRVQRAEVNGRAPLLWHRSSYHGLHPAPEHGGRP